MKKLLLAFIIVSSSILTTTAQCEQTGLFQDGPTYDVAGITTLSFINNSAETLAFDANFSTASGPDLHVYISNSSTINSPAGVLQTPETLDLGLLKSINGIQSYDVSSLNIAENEYQYIVVHCAFHNHHWGHAQLGTVTVNNCSTLSLYSTIINNSISIYPSVVQNGEITVESSTTEATTVTIYSINGNQVTPTFPLTNKKSRIDVSPLSSGIYFITFISQKNKISKKIIIH